LNAYGAATWGQFFIYQGFNEKAGWMHTSSAVDAVDEYLETVTRKGDHYVYKHGAEEKPVEERVIAIPYKTPTGMAERKITAYFTPHGPIVRAANDKWVAIALMQEPVKALTQSFSRTKATDFQSFKKTMDLHTNSSNNTIFADASGNIAYFHGNYIPKRDTKFDWTRPVDGSDPATDYKGVMSVDETPLLLNPTSGCSTTPTTRRGRRLGRAVPRKKTIPPTSTPAASPRAVCTQFGCSRTRRISHSTAWWRLRMTAISRGSKSRCPD
jgi:acyl-homoserine lactone acylase PvdQ